MRILFTTPVLEHPPAGGPQLRIENSIKALSRVADVYVVSRSDRRSVGGDQAESFFRRYCREFVYAPSASKETSANRYVRKFRSILRNLGGHAVSTDAQFLIDAADRFGADLIWFGFGNISFDLIRRVKALRPSLPLVCDSDSVWSRFVLRELPYETNPLRRAWIRQKGMRKEQEERAWVNLCEVSTAVSEVDAQYYRSIARNPERVRIFSNVIDLDSYVQVPERPAGLKVPCMYLAGTFGHYNSPMDRAARWVLDEVLPRVQQNIPNIHFYIVGKDSDRTLGQLRNPAVTVTGKLPSVLPYLCHAGVALVPLQFESGTRFKIMEAAACGVPVVSTTLGAEGIPVENGKHLLLADTADEFAESICRILNDADLAKNLADNARELIRTHYSVDTLEQEARQIVSQMCPAITQKKA